MTQPSSRTCAAVFLASLALAAQEIVWTRIFSGEFFYTFAFLILSLAVLGLGMGALALRLLPALQKPERLGPIFLATALLALAGPPLVLHLGLDFSRVLSSWAMFGRLLGTVLLLASAYFAGGMGLSLLFRLHHTHMSRLYMWDLVGAALGVCAAIFMMNTLGTPATTLLIPLGLLAAAACLGGIRTWAAAALLAAGALFMVGKAERLVTRPRPERLPVVRRIWDAMALLKIMDAGEERNINIDNAANTPVSPFDGNWEAYRAQPSGFLADPKRLMDRMGGSCRFASLGSGGGGDVMLALRNGAQEVHAVEVNPAINRLLLPGGELAGFSGNLYSDPRVKVVSEDARAYLRRQEGRFDIIYSFSSNTFSALASGAFALAENYVFTTEAFADYHRALSPRGYLIMEHQFYMPRLVSEALEGLRRQGVAEPEKHIAVYSALKGRRHILLMGKAPLDGEAIRGAFLALEEGDPGLMRRVWPEPEAGADPLIGRIVREGWQSVARQHPTDLSPATDNRPFTAQQGQMRNLNLKALKTLETWEFKGFPLSKLIITAILAVVLLVALPLNFLPVLRPGPRLRAPGWAYFLAIGVGFMALEVVLIQQFTLFIGSSAHTVAAILFTLLLASGLGSLNAPRFGDRTPFLVILGWLLLDILAFPLVCRLLGGLALPLRMAAAGLLLAPLGFFMGMAFPKGTARVGELVDWGFAVNGAASVAGSAAVMLVSFQGGFRVSLLFGGAAYLVAMLLLATRRPWVRG